MFQNGKGYYSHNVIHSSFDNRCRNRNQGSGMLRHAGATRDFGFTGRVRLNLLPADMFGHGEDPVEFCPHTGEWHWRHDVGGEGCI